MYEARTKKTCLGEKVRVLQQYVVVPRKHRPNNAMRPESRSQLSVARRQNLRSRQTTRKHHHAAQHRGTTPPAMNGTPWVNVVYGHFSPLKVLMIYLSYVYIMSSGRGLTFLGTAFRSCPESAEIWRTSAWGQTGLPTPPSCGLPVERENGACRKQPGPMPQNRPSDTKEGTHRLRYVRVPICAFRKEGRRDVWGVAIIHATSPPYVRLTKTSASQQSAPTRPSYSLNRTPHRSTRIYGTYQ